MRSKYSEKNQLDFTQRTTDVNAFTSCVPGKQHVKSCSNSTTNFFVFNSLLIKKSITGGSIQNTVCDKCCVTVLSGTNIIYSIKLRVHICLWAGACEVCLFMTAPLYLKSGTYATINSQFSQSHMPIEFVDASRIHFNFPIVEFQIPLL